MTRIALLQPFLLLALVLAAFLAGFAEAGELQDAAATGDLEKIMRLLTEKPELLNRQDRGTTALHEAARHGHLEVVECLLKSGADVNATDNSGLTPLKLALGYGHQKVADLLRRNGGLEKAAGSVRTSPPVAPAAPTFLGPFPGTNHQTAAGTAPPQGLLLPTAVTNPLPRVASNAATNASPAISPVLFPIHEAARVGELTHVAALLKEWPEFLEATDEKGQTPLHAAVLGGRKDVTAYLLKRQANVNARSKTGYTPLHWAAAKGLTNVLPVLLAAGADVNAQNLARETSLLLAARNARLDATRWLLAYKANPNLEDRTGNTPLLVSASLGDVTAVEELLKGGARPDGADPTTGASPLHLAIAMRSQRLLEPLLTSGANVNARDAQGATPLDYALRDGQDSLATLLRAKGAGQGSTREWGPLEQGFVENYRRLETVLLRGTTAEKRRALTEILPTKAELEKIFVKDSDKAWKAVGELSHAIRSASERDLAARGGSEPALRLQLQPPSPLADFARQRGYLAANLPMGALLVSRQHRSFVTEDYCFVNPRWVVLPPMDKVFPEWRESLKQKKMVP